MEFTSITIVGVGNLPIAPQILGALATYFGERPLDLRFYDEDLNSLLLTKKICESFCVITKANHRIDSYTSLDVALEFADRIIFMNGMPSSGSDAITESEPAKSSGLLQKTLEISGQNIPILSFVKTSFDLDPQFTHVTHWPEPLKTDSPLTYQFQLLRWANGEEYPTEFLNQEEATLLHRWLDSP